MADGAFLVDLTCNSAAPLASNRRRQWPGGAIRHGAAGLHIGGGSGRGACVFLTCVVSMPARRGGAAGHEHEAAVAGRSNHTCAAGLHVRGGRGRRGFAYSPPAKHGGAAGREHKVAAAGRRSQTRRRWPRHRRRQWPKRHFCLTLPAKSSGAAGHKHEAAVARKRKQTWRCRPPHRRR